jgi:hypothetical protein
VDNVGVILAHIGAVWAHVGIRNVTHKRPENRINGIKNAQNPKKQEKFNSPPAKGEYPEGGRGYEKGGLPQTKNYFIISSPGRGRKE